MKKIPVTSLAVLGAALLCSPVQANLINGAIGFSGAFTAVNTVGPGPLGPTTDLLLADIIAFGPTFVFTSANDLTMPFGAPVAMIGAIGVNPAVTPATPLWSVGGFSFTPTLLTQDPATSMALTVHALGTVSGGGLDPTQGEFIATFNSLGQGSLTWSASTTTLPTVPDSGLTLTLLGLALTGVEGLRRRFAGAE